MKGRVPGVVEAGREYSGEVEDMALPAGHGVIRLGGLVVFAPGCVPGDRVRIRIAKPAGRFAYGDILAIEKESPLRERPSCPHFGRCGGCDLQALSYEAQLRIKENHLLQALKRIGGEDMEGEPISPMVPSVDRFFYRGKIEFSFGRAQGRTTVGLSGRSSPFSSYAGRVVPVDGCLLFSPVAGQVLPLVVDALSGSGLMPYDAAAGKGTLQRLVIREAKGTGEVMVHVVAASDLGRRLSGLKDRLAALPQVASFYATGNRATRLLSGKPAIDEKLSGLTFRIYPFSFFQPNPMTAGLLYERLASFPGIEGSRRALGLYCGSGPVELHLARVVKEVTGIDSSGDNIACARENARLNGSENCTFIEDKAERAGQVFAGKTDLLVVDPPRRGMSGAALAAVRRIGPERIAYISCNPTTLARDLKDLKGSYRAKEIVPFDFFPHTAHFEVLTLLERA
jgi:23S rRNA (uracil1939-C5)-methyltransferase